MVEVVAAGRRVAIVDGWVGLPAATLVSLLAVRAWWLPTSVEPARVGCERDRRNFDEPPLLIDDEIGIRDRGSVDVGRGPKSVVDICFVSRSTSWSVRRLALML